MTSSTIYDGCCLMSRKRQFYLMNRPICVLIKENNGLFSHMDKNIEVLVNSYLDIVDLKMSRFSRLFGTELMSQSKY